MIEVTDPLDPRVDEYRGLKGRESGDVLWAEGPTVVERLLTSGLRTRSLLLSSAAYQRLAALVDRQDAPVLVAEQGVIDHVVGFHLHRGAIAVADRPALRGLDELLRALPARSRLVVLEGINDPENLGAIGRTARALGADGLILDPISADPYYRRSVRVSMGELLHLPIARSSLDDAFAQLAAGGFDVWALTPSADAAPIGSLASPPRLALVAGAEGPGLTPGVLTAHRNVRIPLRPGVDSLNVGHAIAAALAVVQSSTP